MVILQCIITPINNIKAKIMIEVTSLTQDDLSTIETLEDGTLTIPTGLLVFKEGEDTTELDNLTAELALMTEPTDEELIEEGRMSHPYFIAKKQLELLINTK